MTDVSADEFFRADAERLGIPIVEYYRINGMIPPGEPESISSTSSHKNGERTYDVRSTGDEAAFGLAGGIAGLDGNRA